MYVVGLLSTSLEDEMYSFRSHIVIGAFGLLNLFIKVQQNWSTVVMRIGQRLLCCHGGFLLCPKNVLVFINLLVLHFII